MLYILIGILISCIVVWLICRLVTFALVSVAEKISGISIRIDKVRLFSFEKIHCKWDNILQIEIEKLWISSCYINKHARKPLTVCASGARIQVDLAALASFEQPPSQNVDDANTTDENAGRQKLLNKLSYLQYVDIRLEDLVIILLHGPFLNCLVHVNINDVNLLYGVNGENITINILVDNFCAKALRGDQEENQVNAPVCLSHVSFSQHLTLEVDVHQHFIKVCKCVVTHPTFNITEAFIGVINGREEPTTDRNVQRPMLPTSPVIARLLHFIPQMLVVDVDDAQFVICKETAMRTLMTRVEHFSCSLEQKWEQTTLQYLDSQCEIKNVSIVSPQANIARLDRLNMSFMSENDQLDIKGDVTGGFLGYHHEEWQYWTSIVMKNRPIVQQNISSSRTKRVPMLIWKMVTISVKAQHLSGAVASATCAGLKAGVVSLTVDSTIRPEYKGDGVTTEHDSKFELEMHSVYVKQADGGAASADLTPKHHYRYTPFFCGMLMIKSYHIGKQLNINALLDSVQLELASPTLNMFNLFLPYFIAKPKLVPSTSAGRSSQKPSNSFTELSMHTELSNVNIYFVAENSACTMIRHNLINLVYKSTDFTCCVLGTKILYMPNLSQVVPVVRAQDVQNYAGSLRALNVSFDLSRKSCSVRTEDEIHFTWSYGLHMSCYEVISELFRTKSLNADDSNIPKPPKRNKTALLLDVNLEAKMDIKLILSEGHKIAVSLPSLNISKKSDRTSVETELMNVAFDQHEILKIEMLKVYSQHHSHEVKLERESLGLINATNRAWVIDFNKLSLLFPHKYNFAKCYEQIINLNKWRKLVHNVIKKPFTLESPLPPDIVIKVKSFSMQICDDPFEVRLGDNYELMCDEEAENEKRTSAMDKRVQELRKTRGLLQLAGGKVEELYAQLRKKSADIYVQRSKQLYVSAPMRTKLFTWTITGLQVTALADRSFHGKDNAVKHMRQIDPDSPYPEEQEYTTLWCRQVMVEVESFVVQLRDYPLPMFDIQDMHLWGKLVGAEAMPIPRAKRSCTINAGEPWGDFTVYRSMPPLKFYHDFSCDVKKFSITYGPCWEPTMAQLNQALNFINKPSLDPSPPLPFWDKFRNLLHGRLTMSVDKMRWLYHASLYPYNKTELMDWTWTGLVLDWTNAKWILKGDLDIFARTASKYDDCNLLHLPNLRFCVKLEWLCVGDPNDHHAVMPCAPDKVPEFSLEEHDSYKAFRSQNLNMSISFETKPRDGLNDVPSCLFYNSTLRWMDKVKMCMARVARPIKRGKIFNLLTPRKRQLTRHFKNLQVSMKIHDFQVCYWVSFAKQHGLEMCGRDFSLNVTLQLSLVPYNDGLRRRPRSDWRIRQFGADLGTTTIWLCSLNTDEDFANIATNIPVNKTYFLSLEKVCYQRADELPSGEEQESHNASELHENTSIHKLQIYSCKAIWTLHNRNVAISLYDAIQRALTLKKNLSSAALKGFKVDNLHTPVKSNRMGATSPDAVSPLSLTKIQSGPAYSMLQKLVIESDSKFVAVHEEISGGNVPVEDLHGIAACGTDDVIRHNWHIEMYSSQVMVRGVETRGYVIVSTGKSTIRNADRRPVWRGQQLRSKSTWVGDIEGMQYYATVDPPIDTEDIESSIQWLTQDQIMQAMDTSVDQAFMGVESMVGSIQSVGYVITDDSSTALGGAKQLQRIISRCKCQFFYAAYGEVEDDTLMEMPIPPYSTPDPNNMWKKDEGVDSFSLLHHDLNIYTNSLQYAMILDIVNNLLLYQEPKKKELTEKVENMRFQLQLTSIQDQKTPILESQNKLRELIEQIRKYEKELHLLSKALEEPTTSDSTDLLLKVEDIEAKLRELKEKVNTASDELDVMVRSFKECQLIDEAVAKRQTTTTNQEAAVSRRIELCFKHAEWRMTEADGQIGIADLVLRDFLYTKINRDDDSGLHQLELGFVKVTNILPGTLYKDVLGPQDPKFKGFSERQMMLRVLCKFKSPVGGISIRDHLEVNVVPLKIELTKRFYNTAMKFFFPEKTEEHEDSSDDDEPQSSSSKPKKKKSGRVVARSNFYVDDIHKMKERAAKNNMFLYVKITEVLLQVSYKGLKDKNISDVRDFSFLLPTIEYHSQTWTWLDLLLAIKDTSKRVLISQAIKQKLHLKSRTMDDAMKADVQEEDEKARLLFGAKLLGSEKPSGRKSLFSKK